MEWRYLRVFVFSFYACYSASFSSSSLYSRSRSNFYSRARRLISWSLRSCSSFSRRFLYSSCVSLIFPSNILTRYLPWRMGDSLTGSDPVNCSVLRLGLEWPNVECFTSQWGSSFASNNEARGVKKSDPLYLLSVRLWVLWGWKSNIFLFFPEL